MHVHTPAISSSRRGLSKRNLGEPPMQGTCMTFNFPVANQRKFSSSSKKVILLLKGILVYLKCYHFNSTESRKIINILLPLYTKPLKSAVYLTWTAHPKSDQPHCKCWTPPGASDYWPYQYHTSKHTGLFLPDDTPLPVSHILDKDLNFEMPATKILVTTCRDNFYSKEKAQEKS